MPTWPAFWGGVSMIITSTVWMLGSAVHYTYLPKCLSRSLPDIVNFGILQAALTGFVSWSMRRISQKSKQTRQTGTSAFSHTIATIENRTNILIAGAAFAVAITMTNASVAYGSVSGSRMVKSLEPAIVAALQLLAGMDIRSDFPWVLLLAFAVSMMLAVAPTGITMLSAAAALVSTAGISTRNVFVKKHMLAVKAAETSSLGSQAGEEVVPSAQALGAASAPSFSDPQDVQTNLNFVTCAILCTVASGWVALRGWATVDVAVRKHVHASDLVIASISFAAFQVAALKVLESVSPTRQAAIKSLQNALTTAWALIIDSNGLRHSSFEIVPSLSWGICVIALASDAKVYISTGAGERHWLPICALGGRGSRAKGEGAGSGAGSNEAKENNSRISVDTAGTRLSARAQARVWLIVYCSCCGAMLMQCAIMAMAIPLGPLHARIYVRPK
jgi:hypothetical protein